MTDTKEIICEKCETKGTTKFCANCGTQLIPDKIRSEGQIKHMQELVEKAAKIRSKKGGSPTDLVFGLLLSTTLGWVLGKDTSPLQLIIRGDDKNDEDLRTLVELEKMYN